MPFLSLDADLPPARRVIIAGPSGSGKTTACALVSDRIGVPHHEIDALFHGPGWQPRPQFHDDVARFVATEAWVTEWQYSEVRGLLAERAELLIWLDLPLYFARKKNYKLALQSAASEYGAYFFLYYMTAHVNARASTFTLIIPFMLLRLGLMIGNWGQHALVDELEPDSDYRSSITLVDVPVSHVP